MGITSIYTRYIFSFGRRDGKLLTKKWAKIEVK